MSEITSDMILMLLHTTIYSLNILRKKFFADFEVFWLTTKILSLKILD